MPDFKVGDYYLGGNKDIKKALNGSEEAVSVIVVKVSNDKWLDSDIDICGLSIYSKSYCNADSISSLIWSSIFWSMIE